MKAYRFDDERSDVESDEWPKIEKRRKAREVASSSATMNPKQKLKIKSRELISTSESSSEASEAPALKDTSGNESKESNHLREESNGSKNLEVSASTSESEAPSNETKRVKRRKIVESDTSSNMSADEKEGKDASDHSDFYQQSEKSDQKSTVKSSTDESSPKGSNAAENDSDSD
ncbi:unnamed protein product [Soboliphyme baturini]|uniref:Dentin sialophosphoprotein-like n=1 Tax=Soboliphyme baturini TaxID=241478 RepID=A0A183JA26_9BILA|nr:unnamed protein product [Soboliphyme baturini]